MTDELRARSDPTYEQDQIDANLIWRVAFILSEILNDNAPIGWGRYIYAAERLNELSLLKRDEPGPVDRKHGDHFREQVEEALLIRDWDVRERRLRLILRDACNELDLIYADTSPPDDQQDKLVRDHRVFVEMCAKGFDPRQADARMFADHVVGRAKSILAAEGERDE